MKKCLRKSQENGHILNVLFGKTQAVSQDLSPIFLWKLFIKYNKMILMVEVVLQLSTWLNDKRIQYVCKITGLDYIKIFSEFLLLVLYFQDELPFYHFTFYHFMNCHFEKCHFNLFYFPCPFTLTVWNETLLDFDFCPLLIQL